MSDYEYSALGGDCEIQEGNHTETYQGAIVKMGKTLNTWTSENAEKQQIYQYENGLLEHDELD